MTNHQNQLIDNYHVDDFIFCGDFNARCGDIDIEETPESEGNPIQKGYAVHIRSR